MALGRPKAGLTLAPAERERLAQWVRRPKTAQALALRARIILRCAEGKKNKEVAAELDVSQQMVCKWRGRFLTLRLDGLLDEPRPGAPRRIGDAQIEQVIVKTRDHAAGCDALEYPLAGGADGPESDDDLSDLARLRPPAAPQRDLQALPRPAVYREGA